MKRLRDYFKSKKLTDIFNLAVAVAVTVTAFICACRYVAFGDIVLGISMTMICVLFALVSSAAYSMRLPVLNIAVGVGGIVMHTLTNYSGIMFGEYVAVAVLGTGGGFAATLVQIVGKQPPVKAFTSSLAVAIAIFIFGGVVCASYISAARGREYAADELWAVPEKYDGVECPEKGTLERVEYATKAYATDGRAVTKSAYVYLPYGYDESQEYDILYLMHGTGDDEAYWLEEYSYNKTMVDNLIYYGDIRPLIIVTPTFYTEDDCADNLDELTYSFRDELRLDLMPYIESRYSTYAQTADDVGFEASRDHRAFAGLSRGAVTMFHSAMCASLDYFSWFGAFSGSRTTREEFVSSLQSEEFADYDINYLYVTGGAFDFALPSQIRDYRQLLSAEDRLTEGVNTSFVSLPVQRHAMGNWHINLYNFLQKIFIYAG